MTSIQIVSNSKNKNGGTNYINDFTTTLIEPIDAENQDVFLEVLNFTYPLTIKNIQKNECTIQVKIEAHEINDIFNFSFETPVIKIPEGSYDIKDLLYTINLILTE